MHIFRVLSAILHLGNVEIGSSMDEGDEACHIDDLDPHLQIASVLLGVDHDQLHQWLCHRRIATTKDVFTKPLTPPQVWFWFVGTVFSCWGSELFHIILHAFTSSPPPPPHTHTHQHLESSPLYSDCLNTILLFPPGCECSWWSLEAPLLSPVPVDCRCDQ